MAKIYLSPSTQEFNKYYSKNGTEESYMNLLADKIEPYLKRSGIDFERNNKDGTVIDVVEDSNKSNYDLHLALHSNASPESLKGKLMGPDIYYYPTSSKGKTAANIIAGNLNQIYPYPRLVNTLASTSLYELRKTKAPATLIEIGYHDNPEDEKWIINNLDLIAKNISKSVAEYLDVEFKG